MTLVIPPKPPRHPHFLSCAIFSEIYGPQAFLGTLFGSLSRSRHSSTYCSPASSSEFPAPSLPHLGFISTGLLGHLVVRLLGAFDVTLPSMPGGVLAPKRVNVHRQMGLQDSGRAGSLPPPSFLLVLLSLSGIEISFPPWGWDQAST